MMEGHNMIMIVSPKSDTQKGKKTEEGGKEMGSRSHTECPLARVRAALRWDRHDLAALAGVPYNLLANTELGYFNKIPVVILAAIAPYLATVGTDSERLQEDFRAWRQGLGAEVRARTTKGLVKRVGA